MEFIKQFTPYAWNLLSVPNFLPWSCICALSPTYCIFTQIWLRFMLYAMHPTLLKSTLSNDWIELSLKIMFLETNNCLRAFHKLFIFPINDQGHILQNFVFWVPVKICHETESCLDIFDWTYEKCVNDSKSLKHIEDEKWGPTHHK